MKVLGPVQTQGSSPWVDVKALGAVGDGTTDDSAKIQAAITAQTATGGQVLIPGGATYAIASSITLVSGVTLVLGPGAIVKWTGGAGTMFTSGTTDPLMRAGVIGLPGARINPNGAATTVFDLHSPQFCLFSDLEVLAGTATTKVLRLTAGVTNASGYENTRNAVFNVFRQVLVSGVCGTVLELDGQTTGVITLNHFDDISGSDVRVFGVRIVDWTDNNAFGGIHRYSLGANNAVGVIMNDSATPTSNVGVYANHFDYLAVDTFLTMTGRIGLKLNNVKQTVVRNFFQEPTAEGGSFVADASAESYHVTQVGVGGVNTIIAHTKGIYQNGYFLLSDDNNKIGAAGSDPTWLADAAAYVQYNRSAIQWLFAVAGAYQLRLTAAGAYFPNGVGFFNTTPVTTKPTVSGSRGANAALASLLTQLASLGLITDSTS